MKYLSLILAACLLTACAPTGNVVREEPLEVGAILPLSGDYAEFGQEAVKGIQIAQRELEAQGSHFTITYEDDRTFNPAAAHTAAQKLLSVDGVDVALTLVVDQAKPIAHLFNESKTPLLVLWDSNDYVNDYVFSIGFSAEEQGLSMADHAYSTLGLRTAAIVEDITPGAEIVCSAFRRRFEELGGTILLHEKTVVGEEDYRSLITKIQNRAPDAVYIGIISPENFLRQAHNAGLEAEVLSADTIDRDLVERIDDAAEGIHFTYMYIEDEQQMRSLYRVLHGGEPENLHMVSLGYNGLHAIAQASEASTVYEGLIGITGEDRMLKKTERIYHVVQGDIVPADS